MYDRYTSPFNARIFFNEFLGLTGFSDKKKTFEIFPRNFEFSQTSTSVSITYGDTGGGNVFYFFYKITRRKLKKAFVGAKKNEVELTRWSC